MPWTTRLEKRTRSLDSGLAAKQLILMRRGNDPEEACGGGGSAASSPYPLVRHREHGQTREFPRIVDAPPLTRESHDEKMEE